MTTLDRLYAKQHRRFWTRRGLCYNCAEHRPVKPAKPGSKRKPVRCEECAKMQRDSNGRRRR